MLRVYRVWTFRIVKKRAKLRSLGCGRWIRVPSGVFARPLSDVGTLSGRILMAEPTLQSVYIFFGCHPPNRLRDLNGKHREPSLSTKASPSLLRILGISQRHALSSRLLSQYPFHPGHHRDRFVLVLLCLFEFLLA